MGGLLEMNKKGFEGARGLLYSVIRNVLPEDLDEHRCKKLACCLWLKLRI